MPKILPSLEIKILHLNVDYMNCINLKICTENNFFYKIFCDFQVMCYKLDSWVEIVLLEMKQYTA